MLRLLFLLLGAQLLKSRWLVLVGVAVACLSLGVAIFIDIADDGLLSVPLDTLALLLVVEGVVEILSAIVANLRINWPGVAKGAGFLFIAFLVFDNPGDNNITASLLFGMAFLLDGLFRLISTSLMRCRLWHKKIWLGVTELLFSVVIFSNWPFHHHVTVPLCFALMLLGWGLVMLSMARQIWQLPANASVTTLPMYTSRGLRHPHGTAYVHPSFPAEAPDTPLIMLIWTPVGSASVKERRLLFDRYLAAVDQQGVISTGHAALQFGDEIYISHYPVDDIDRDFTNFRAVLRAGEEYDVPGCFLSSLQQEIDDWCIPDLRINLSRFNAEALRNYWQIYSADTTYNLTSRNCSTSVIQALDVAMEGVLSERGLSAFRLLLEPDFWLLGLVRGRAEGMTWTPGLVMDYVLLLKKVIAPPRRLAWHSRLRESFAQRRALLVSHSLRLKKGAPRSGEPLP